MRTKRSLMNALGDTLALDAERRPLRLMCRGHAHHLCACPRPVGAPVPRLLRAGGAVPEFGGQRPSPKTVLVVHLEHDLRDLFDGADHHHQGGARRAAGQRCINAAGAASLPPPRRSHRLQPDRRLHSMCGRRPSGDAFASIFDASNPAELGSSLLASSSLPRSSVCTRWWW